jgi:hypothetical protein
VAGNVVSVRATGLLVVLVVLAACTPASPAREERTAPATAHEDRAAEPGERASAAGPAGAVPPAVVLTAEVGDAAVAPVLQNHDAAPAKLAGVLRVEREEAGAFTPLASAELSLRTACGTPAPECIELVPGAELRPPPWQAPGGRTQCDGGTAAKAPAGRYRFVAEVCAGGARIAGAPFELD